MSERSGARAALAEAIRIRNVAARQLSEAEGALRAVSAVVPGEYRADLSANSAISRARDVVYEAQAALDELKSSLGGASLMFGGDRSRVLEHVLKHHGSTPEDLLAAAEARIKDAEAALAPVEKQKVRLTAYFEIAKRQSDEAASAVKDAARAVLHESAIGLSEIAKATQCQALRALSALNFAARGLNLSHSDIGPNHELWTAKELLSNYINFYDAGKKAQQDAGAAPWLTAFNNLLVDADAPLPGDATSKTRKAA